MRSAEANSRGFSSFLLYSFARPPPVVRRKRKEEVHGSSAVLTDLFNNIRSYSITNPEYNTSDSPVEWITNAVRSVDKYVYIFGVKKKRLHRAQRMWKDDIKWNLHIVRPKWLRKWFNSRVYYDEVTLRLVNNSYRLFKGEYKLWMSSLNTFFLPQVAKHCKEYWRRYKALCFHSKSHLSSRSSDSNLRGGSRSWNMYEGAWAMTVG